MFYEKGIQTRPLLNYDADVEKLYARFHIAFKSHMKGNLISFPKAYLQTTLLFNQGLLPLTPATLIHWCF